MKMLAAAPSCDSTVNWFSWSPSTLGVFSNVQGDDLSHPHFQEALGQRSLRLLTCWMSLKASHHRQPNLRRLVPHGNDFSFYIVSVSKAVGYFVLGIVLLVLLCHQNDRYCLVPRAETNEASFTGFISLLLYHTTLRAHRNDVWGRRNRVLEKTRPGHDKLSFSFHLVT